MRKFILLICLIFLLPIGTTFAYRDADKAPEPREVQAILEVGNQILEAEMWLIVSAEESAFWSSVGWYAENYDAVAHIVYFHSQNTSALSTLETYLESQDFENLFANYDGYQLGQRCELEGAILQEFTTTLGGTTYNTRYWVMPVSETRIMALHLIFPVGQEYAMDFYVRRFMPDRVSCATIEP